MSKQPVDKRGKLDEEPFDYRQMGEGRLFIYWNGNHIKSLKGDEARKLLARLTDADATDVQLTLAKATGNFKRGNERR